MKKLVFIYQFILVSILGINAQDSTFYLVVKLSEKDSLDNLNWNLNSITFCTGETPLTSGNTFSGVFSKQKSTILVDYNATLGELIYLYSPIKQMSFGPSGGFVKNTPWFAPILTFSLFKGMFKTLHWVGWSFGDPEEKGTSEEILFCFSYHQISLLYAGFECSYANNVYQKNNPEDILCMKKTFELNNQFSTFFGTGYMFNTEKFLWSTGISFNL